MENWNLKLQGFGLALLTRGMDWSHDEVEVFLVRVRKSFEDTSVHAYHNVHVVTERKATKEETLRMGDCDKSIVLSRGVWNQGRREEARRHRRGGMRMEGCRGAVMRIQNKLEDLNS